MANTRAANLEYLAKELARYLLGVEKSDFTRMVEDVKKEHEEGMFAFWSRKNGIERLESFIKELPARKPTAISEAVIAFLEQENSAWSNSSANPRLMRHLLKKMNYSDDISLDSIKKLADLLPKAVALIRFENKIKENKEILINQQNEISIKSKRIKELKKSILALEDKKIQLEITTQQQAAQIKIMQTQIDIFKRQCELLQSELDSLLRRREKLDKELDEKVKRIKCLNPDIDLKELGLEELGKIDTKYREFIKVTGNTFICETNKRGELNKELDQLPDLFQQREALKQQAKKKTKKIIENRKARLQDDMQKCKDQREKNKKVRKNLSEFFENNTFSAQKSRDSNSPTGRIGDKRKKQIAGLLCRGTILPPPVYTTQTEEHPVKRLSSS